MPQTIARLAIDGGPPVRTEKLPHYRGAALFCSRARSSSASTALTPTATSTS